MPRKVNYSKLTQFEPERCWVGDTHKISYKTREEAELAARVAEHDYKISKLSVYKCEFGDHWHLSSN